MRDSVENPWLEGDHGFEGYTVKHGQSILYTSAEIIACIPQRGGGLYAVCTSSKSHNGCTGTGRCPKRSVDLGR